MKKKSGALEKFIEPETETNEPQTAVRKRGQNGKRGITIRMNQTQWRRAKEAAMAEDITMAELFMLALSERLKAQRLPGMFEP